MPLSVSIDLPAPFKRIDHKPLEWMKGPLARKMSMGKSAQSSAHNKGSTLQRAREGPGLQISCVPVGRQAPESLSPGQRGQGWPSLILGPMRKSWLQGKSEWMSTFLFSLGTVPSHRGPCCLPTFHCGKNFPPGWEVSEMLFPMLS